MKTDVKTLILGKYFLASLILALLILEMTFFSFEGPARGSKKK